MNEDRLSEGVEYLDVHKERVLANHPLPWGIRQGPNCAPLRVVDANGEPVAFQSWHVQVVIAELINRVRL